MTYLQRTLDFIDTAQRVETMNELERAMQATLAEFNVTQFSLIALASLAGTAARRPVGLTRACNADWSQLYHEKKYFNYDVVVHSAICSPDPFSWESFDPRALSPDAKRMLAEGRELMHVDGCFAIPIHERGRFEGMISLFYPGRAPDSEMLRMLKLVAIYALEKAKKLHAVEGGKVSKIAPCPLTARQREVLAFSAIGKTDGEVASILSISGKTANHHFERAKLKLGVATRAQAVAIAVHEGWLAL